MADHPLTPEAGSPLADDLTDGLAQARRGDVVPASVVGEDLQRRTVNAHRSCTWELMETLNDGATGLFECGECGNQETWPIDENGGPA